ncbi:Nucleotide-sugar transporter [Phytophthora cactorum]|nr:Nucleotide-sugar transporter [Phytophthora cactorum]
MATAAPAKAPAVKSVPVDTPSSTWIGYVAMVLLAMQFGLQPILYKEFAGEVKNRSVLVIACEGCKLLLSLLTLLSSGALGRVVKTWNLHDSLMASGLPACTYAVQNVLIQIAYQHLPSIVFNLINQTKLLSAALFLYFLMGSASRYSTALVTVELSVYGSLFLMMPAIWSTIVKTPVSESPAANALANLDKVFEGCDYYTLIPVVSNALGGLLVGTVTKYVGGVLKSFALICGIAFTAFVESYVYGAVLPNEVFIAAGLVATSMAIYSSFPYVKKEAKAKTE